jgi:hypothetical protein
LRAAVLGNRTARVSVADRVPTWAITPPAYLNDLASTQSTCANSTTAEAALSQDVIREAKPVLVAKLL